MANGAGTAYIDVRPDTKGFGRDLSRGIDPHVDKNEFALNVLTMLEHRPDERHSELILYPPDQEPVHIQLAHGESLVFFADSVTHQRTRTVAGESIRLVSFGYHPI